MIDVRTFGGLSVLRDGALVALQPKRLLLLVYLLLEGRTGGVRRDDLLALFWPDTDAERARNALRQALFATRGALGADIIVARGNAELVVQHDLVRCDATEFIRLAEAGDHVRADALYTGEFVSTAVHLADTHELQQWIEGTRVRCRRLAASALRARADTPGLSLPDRARMLERLQQLAPYDEATAMQLVAAYVELGDRSTAVERFREFAARLRSDLEIEPSAAFSELIDSARVGEGVLVTPTHGLPAAKSPLRPGAGRSRWRGLTAVAGVVVLLVGLMSLRAAVDPRLVDVGAFEHAGDAEATRAAARAAAQIRGALASVPGVRVLGNVDTRGPWGLLGRTKPATLVLGGVEQLVGGQWRAWFSVTATESDMLLHRSEVQGTMPDSLITLLADRVSAVVATRRDMELHWGETLHRPTTLVALDHYRSAFEAVATGDGAGGIARYEAAWGADSTFVFAGILAAGNALAINDYARGDSLLVALARWEPRMLPLERHQYLRARALARSDVLGTLSESRAVAELEPDAPFLVAQYAEDAYLANRPREAVEALDALDRLTANAPDRTNTHVIRAAALHLMGQFKEEQRVVDAGIASNASQAHLLGFRIPPLAALGQLDTLRVMLAAMATRDDGRDIGRLYRAAALELQAHGFPIQAARLFDEGVLWLQRHPAGPTSTIARQVAAAELLLDAGRFDAAQAQLRQLDSLPNVTFTSGQRSAVLNFRGILAAMAGRAAEARALSDTLAELAERGRNGIETYRRARIAAVLGDPIAATMLVEQALQEGFVTHREVHIDPVFARLRQDDRFRRVTAPRG